MSIIRARKDRWEVGCTWQVPGQPGQGTRAGAAAVRCVAKPAVRGHGRVSACGAEHNARHAAYSDCSRVSSTPSALGWMGDESHAQLMSGAYVASCRAVRCAQNRFVLLGACGGVCMQAVQ